MADTNAWVAETRYTVHQRPGEDMWHTWLRGLDERPAGHCGPIYMR